MDTSSGNVVVGTSATLSTTLSDPTGVPFNGPVAPTLVVIDPAGNVTNYGSEITNPSDGVYVCVVPATLAGEWHWRWLVAGEAADEGYFTAETEFAGVSGTVIAPPDLTNLLVLVPGARRRCEGPFGPPPGKPPLSNDQLYEMVADACAQVILNSGTLFGHQLLVASRDPLVGYPTAWQTDVMLQEWEAAVIMCQVALTYFFFVLRDLRLTVSVKNEGTEYSYSVGVGAIRDYLDLLKTERDMALVGLRLHNPVLDRYASNIRVRDQATVALLEWWDTNRFDNSGAGLPGGQEAAMIPWTPGWTGPGFTP